MKKDMSELMTIEFEGLPPTVNQMYRSAGNRRYKQNVVADWQEDIASLMAKEWNKTKRRSALGAINKAPYAGRAAVRILFTVNTNRRWDIDNRMKALLDCLEMSGVLEDDSQIDYLSVTREKGAKLQTRIILLEC